MNARTDSMTDPLKIAITEGLELAAIEKAESLISSALQTGACDDEDLLLKSALELTILNIDKLHQQKLMQDAAFFLYISGRPDRGLIVALKARDFALSVANSKSTSAALAMVGICAADTGNLPLAMEAYSDALSLAQKSNDVSREGKVWQNLGSALAYSGLFRDANACFARALELAKVCKDLGPLSAGIQTNIALNYLHLDEIGLGLAAIQKSIELSSNPVGAHAILNRVLAENCSTRLCLEVDDLAGARTHATAARYFASQSKSPRADISASVAEGLAEVFSGQSDIGISRLTVTLEHGIALKVTIREVLIAIVKAHEHIGQHDKALEYLNMMLEQQRKTQAANVLQHVKRHLEQLHIADKDSPIDDATQIMKKLLTRAEVFEGRVAKVELMNERQKSFRQRTEVLERMAVTATLREDSSGERVYRIARLASLLTHVLGEDDHTVFMMEMAARLHDIGKISIPDMISQKATAFSPAEHDMMKMHTTIGADMLAKSEIPELQMAEQIARYHHERWDGSGYPEGLKGEAIPLPARVVALADVFDALTHVRPYRAAFTIDAAIAEISKGRGGQFEPKLVDSFVKLIQLLRREQTADEYGMVQDNLDGLLGQSAKASPLRLARQKIWASIDSVTEGKLALLEIARQPDNAEDAETRIKSRERNALLLSKLTSAEREVVNWISKGKTNPEVAQILGLSKFTVKTHVQRIYNKLGVNSRVTLSQLLQS